MLEKLPDNKTTAVCFVCSQLKGKKRVMKAKGVVEQNVTSEKETKENKPATNKVSAAVVCCFQVFYKGRRPKTTQFSFFKHRLQQQIKDV